MSAVASSRSSAALRLLRRRLLQAVPLMLGVVVINFVLIHLAPGSFLELMTAENQVSDPATVELLRKTYGLEDPVWLQLLKYIWALLHFDFGFSYRQNMPVIQAIGINLPATILLMVSSITLAFAIGVSAGVVASVKVRTVWDTLVSVAAMFFFAAPSFWLGIMMIVLLAVKLGWMPVGGLQTIGGASSGIGWVLDILHHLVLPTLALGLFGWQNHDYTIARNRGCFDRPIHYSTIIYECKLLWATEARARTSSDHDCPDFFTNSLF